MARHIEFILCLLAALLLVPIHGDCSEISEFEQEAEIECVETSTQETVSFKVTESKSKTFTATQHIINRSQPCRNPLSNVLTAHLWIKFLTIIE
ncbi:MAG: hypothetical protein NC421_10875 [Lachnospiraceae bacterium]|nr:hypothetical protein [Lachnospiraceae bacterium]